MSLVPSKVVPFTLRAVASLVADAAFPVVFWLPCILTPGRLMLLPPSNFTPPIVRAVCSLSAVLAFPERLPLMA